MTIQAQLAHHVGDGKGPALDGHGLGTPLARALVDLHLGHVHPEILDVRQRPENLGSLLGMITAAPSLSPFFGKDAAHFQDLIHASHGILVGILGLAKPDGA